MTAMPTWEAFMIPTLRVMSDGIERTRQDIYPLVAKDMGLTDEQMQAVLNSGQLRYENRTGFGISFLTKISALDRPARGSYRITDAGREVLSEFPCGAKEAELRAMAEDPATSLRPYVADPPKGGVAKGLNDAATSMTPIEQVEDGTSRIRDAVAEELLGRLREKQPAFFEQAVVDLLLAMGYGGTGGRGAVTGLSHDGGIDGVIDQDVLGISRVYVQAKRYAADNVVQKPTVQAFVGALSGKAAGGVFISTSRFSEGAERYAAEVPPRIILIDGARLTDLMIRYGVGVQVSETYDIVEIDEDFFA